MKALAPEDHSTLQFELILPVIFGEADRERNLALIRQAVALDPVNLALRRMLAGSYRAAKKFAEAEAETKRLIELNPRFGGHADLAGSYLGQGKLEEALAEIKQEPVEWLRLTLLAQIQWARKARPESDAALNSLSAGYPEQCALQVAMVHAYRHEADKAFEWLERAYLQRDTGLPPIKGDNVCLINLHGDPRWQAFLRKLGMADDQLK